MIANHNILQFCSQRRSVMLPILLFFLLSPIAGQSQSLDYAFAIGPDDMYDNYTYANGLALDREGNTYITGTLEHINVPSNYDFDPSPGKYILSGIPGGGCIEDIYLAKYDTKGNILWGFVLGDTSCDRGQEVTTDDKGNVYIAGQFSNTVDFDPGPGEFLMTGDDFRAGYLAKYNTDGAFIWAIMIQGLGHDELKEIEVDSKGNVYVVGEFFNPLDLDPSGEEFIVTSAGNRDVFLAKYDREGQFLWGHSFGDDNWDKGRAIEVDTKGNVIIGGSFYGVVDVATGRPVVELDAGEGNDMYLVKYDQNGRHLSSFHIGGNETTELSDLELDPSDDIYATGWFKDEEGVDFDPGAGENILISEGASNSFIVHYDKQGAFQMAANIGVPGSSELELGIDGSVFIAGIFTGISDFDPGPATFDLEGNYFDAFIAKYTAGGKLHWAFDIGESFYGLEIGGFGVDRSGGIHITGHFGEAFGNTLDFDPTLTSYIVDYIGGNQDLYVAKYRDPDPLYRVNSGGNKLFDDPLNWARVTPYKHI